MTYITNINFVLIQCPAGQNFEIIASKILKNLVIGKKHLNYASSLPHLLNYQMAPLFSIPPTGTSETAGHPLMYNFDFPISMGEIKDTMLKLTKKKPCLFKTLHGKKHRVMRRRFRAWGAEIFAIFPRNNFFFMQ